MGGIKAIVFVFFVLSFGLSLVTTSIVFAQVGIWRELTRFTGSETGVRTTELFDCEYSIWRINYTYVPGPDFSYFSWWLYSQNDLNAIQGMYSDASADLPSFSASVIHDKVGPFYMKIDSSAENYTIIIEEDISSRYDVTYYIKGDGTVQGTDKILQTGFTYTFTDDIIGKIVVEKSQIIIDGNGHTLDGLQSISGFKLNDINNVTIKNSVIKNCVYGIELSDSSDNKILANSISSNEFGIYSTGGSGNVISKNNLTTNARGIYMWGSFNSIKQNFIVDNRVSGISLYNYSENNAVFANQIDNNHYALHLVDSSFNKIYGNNVTNNNVAAYLENSSNNTIYSNTFINNEIDITSDEQSNNTWTNGTEDNLWVVYNGTDTDGDGIGDTQHVINQEDIIIQPLNEDYVIPEFSSWVVLPLLIAVAVAASVYKKKLKKA